MNELTVVATVIWVGCFVVVAIDSVYRGIHPWFWRLAGLFGGPFALLAYCLVRTQASNK